jgi:glutaredoxin
MLVIYSKNNCPNCVTLKGRLKIAGLDFMEVNVDSDASQRAFLVSSGHKSVPQVYQDGQHVKDIESLFE